MADFREKQKKKYSRLADTNILTERKSKKLSMLWNLSISYLTLLIKYIERSSICPNSSETARRTSIELGMIDHLLGVSDMRGLWRHDNVIIKDNFLNIAFWTDESSFGLNETQYPTYPTSTNFIFLGCNMTS